MGVENNLPEGWIETSLKEVCDVKGGKRLPKGETLVSKKNKHPYIRITDFAGNSINKSKLQFVPNDTFEKISRYIVNENDIIISIVGTIGLVAKIDKELDNASLTENCNKLVNLRGVNNDFIYYYLTSRIGQFEINKNTVGAVQKKLPIYGVLSIKINLPPLAEQKAIAKVLTAFDDKIELLQAQNKTLETMAQTIFKEWFGKYQIGDELPEGWRVGRLGDVIDLQSGFVHNTKVSGDTKVKIAKMGVVDGKNFFNRRSVINYSETIDSKYKLKEDDIIVSTRDVTRDNLIIGNVSLIPVDLANFGLYAGSNTWIIKTDLNQYYLFLILRNRNFRHHIIQSSKGSTIVMITRDAFLNCPFIFPHENVLSEFINTIDPIFKKIKNNNSTIQSLTKTRDTLLPKLMSGQVRVKI